MDHLPIRDISKDWVESIIEGQDITVEYGEAEWQSVDRQVKLLLGVLNRRGLLKPQNSTVSPGAVGVGTGVQL